MTKSFFKKKSVKNSILFTILACTSACILACQSSKSILQQTIEKKSVSKRKLVLFDVKEYDEDGKLIFEKWNDGFTCKYKYDENNNLAGTEQNNGITTLFLDADENNKIELWSDGRTKYYVYQNGKLIKEYFSDSDYTDYYYDENGFETSYKSSSGLVSWNEYNDDGLLVYRKNNKADRYFFDYEFWGNGNIKKRKNYKEKR
jgi:YD repeat-containing protein